MKTLKNSPKLGCIRFNYRLKQHTAINHGDEDRYHLVIDIRADERLRDWLRRSEKTYPPEKGNTDW